MLKKKQKAAQNGRTFRKEETRCSAISKIYEEAGEKQGAKNSAAETKREVMGTPGAEKKHLRMNWK